MKIISWNVNGIRAMLKKNFMEFFNEEKSDILCIQETKAGRDHIQIILPGYEQFWYSAERPGYSGTLVISKQQPNSVQYGLAIDDHDNEGRVITLEFDDFFLVNVYTPNSGGELARLDYRQVWDKAFRKFVKKLDKNKPVIICGDLNVAHTEIDLARPKQNIHNA
ncbi:exodeoxyribonuclease III, partial [Candidatus Woesearchaeota archaeon]|nr:exodeoxyribonuclease III [Candidatus Woesearchaeota archaeon]